MKNKYFLHVTIMELQIVQVKNCNLSDHIKMLLQNLQYNSDLSILKLFEMYSAKKFASHILLYTGCIKKTLHFEI